MNMYAPASKPFGYTLFCDDIREEVNGKRTLVGMYNSAMIINDAFPVALPRLALYISFIEEVGAMGPVEIKLYLPGDEELPTHSFALEVDEARKRAAVAKELASRPKSETFDAIVPHTAVVVLSPLEFRCEGMMRVRVERGGMVYRIGTLQVIGQPDETEVKKDSADVVN